MDHTGRRAQTVVQLGLDADVVHRQAQHVGDMGDVVAVRLGHLMNTPLQRVQLHIDVFQLRNGSVAQHGTVCFWRCVHVGMIAAKASDCAALASIKCVAAAEPLIEVRPLIELG